MMEGSMLDNYEKLAKVFNVSVEYLRGFTAE